MPRGHSCEEKTTVDIYVDLCKAMKTAPLVPAAITNPMAPICTCSFFTFGITLNFDKYSIMDYFLSK